MQFTNRGIAALGAIMLAGAGGAATAHHSFAQEFDQNRPVRITGTVVKFEWVNPHSWIHVQGVNQVTGRTAVWRIEGGAPSALLRRGWNRDSLPSGTRVSVTGFASRDGDTRASASEIVFPDGRTASLSNPTTEAVAAQAKRGR